MLDERLQSVADFVPSGGCVADIGTDHAYLAIELWKADNSRGVIASDKNSGPCMAAQRTVSEAGLTDIVQVRQGDGLRALQPGEADTVCIAGMGGKLIADILAAAPEIVAGLENMVLQPQNGAEQLRGWLYGHDWYVADEQLAMADGRIYQIILAKKGKRDMPDKTRLVLGPVLTEKQPNLFQNHVKNNLESLVRIRNGIEKGNSPDKTRLKQLEEDICHMEAYLR